MKINLTIYTKNDDDFGLFLRWLEYNLGIEHEVFDDNEEILGHLILEKAEDINEIK